LTATLGNKLEDYVRSREPQNRSAILLAESAERLGIRQNDLQEIVKPYSVYIQRLSVGILGSVVNIMSGIVLHNRSRGPYKGGIRLAKDVDLWETTELARLMTLKTALMGVELGGGKSGISVDLPTLHKHMAKEDRYSGTFREFARIAKADIIDRFTDHFGWLFSQHAYIPAPDMGTSGPEMVRIYNQTHDPASVTGKPEGIEGWLPGRKEATGYGVYYAVIKQMQRTGRAPDKCTVAIQGFGNVGSHVAQFLHADGVKVVAITDLFNGAYDPQGLDVPALVDHAREHGGVKGFAGSSITNAELFRLACDFLVPAATGNVVDAGNADNIRAKAVVEAANMPVTYEAMRSLTAKGIDLIPDIYANAGGVIASDLEYRQALGGTKFSYEATLARIRERLDSVDEELLPRMKEGCTMVEAAMDLALARVYETMCQRSLI
jgi:glutamate dehydrogenase/leucine dehydrogenase